MADNINALLGAGICPALLEGTHAGYFSARARRENDEEDRRQAEQGDISAAMKGDRGAVGRVAAGRPTQAGAIPTALPRMDADQRAKPKESADWSVKPASSVLQVDPKDQPAAYELMRQEGLSRGYDMTG